MLVRAKHNQVALKDLKTIVHYLNWTNINDNLALKSKDLKKNLHLLIVQTNNEQLKQYLGISNKKVTNTITTRNKDIVIEENNKMFVAQPKTVEEKPNNIKVYELKEGQTKIDNTSIKDNVIWVDDIEINTSSLMQEVKQEQTRPIKVAKEPAKVQAKEVINNQQDTEVNILSDILNEVKTEDPPKKRRGRPPKKSN